MFLQKTVCTPAILYRKFCRYVGHDEKDCRAYQILREKTVDAYLMKTEEQINIEQAAPEFQFAPQFHLVPQFHPTPQFQPMSQFQVEPQFHPT